MSLSLTPRQRALLKARAHALEPIVQIGQAGLTSAVITEIDQSLTAHGLIKVRVFSDARDAREALLHEAAGALGAAPVQHIGKLLVLWRPPEPKERAEREDRRPGPKVVKVVKFSKSGNHRPQVKKIKVLGNQRIAAGGTLKRAKKTRLKSIKRSVTD